MDPRRQQALVSQLGEVGKRVGEIRMGANGADERTEMTYVDEHGRIIPVEVECRGTMPGSVATRVGLAAGDRILTYDGETVTSTLQLIYLVTHAALGIHRLMVRRGNATMFLDVPAGKLRASLVDVAVETAFPAPPAPHCALGHSRVVSVTSAVGAFIDISERTRGHITALQWYSRTAREVIPCRTAISSRACEFTYPVRSRTKPPTCSATPSWRSSRGSLQPSSGRAARSFMAAIRTV
jgi:hypothetical protein